MINVVTQALANSAIQLIDFQKIIQIQRCDENVKAIEILFENLVLVFEFHVEFVIEKFIVAIVCFIEVFTYVFEIIE